eukprot:5174694-Ditylum_brightwellii.AAC.1
MASPTENHSVSDDIKDQSQIDKAATKVVIESTVKEDKAEIGVDIELTAKEDQAEMGVTIDTTAKQDTVPTLVVVTGSPE